MKKRQQLQLFVRSLFLQTGWNYTKFQNLGLAFAMWPVLARLYRNDKDALPSVLNRYLEIFNTQPYMASFCLGTFARQEELIAQANTLTEFNERITEWGGLKRALSITAASIGDRLFWGTLKPFTLLVALVIWLVMGVNFFDIPLSQNPNLGKVLAAAAAAFCVFNGVALFVRWQGLRLSYESDGAHCYGLTCFHWNETIYHAKKWGLISTILTILLGFYCYLKAFSPLQIHFLTRAVLVISFIMISFIARRLRIPTMYLYLGAVVVLNLVCYF